MPRRKKGHPLADDPNDERNREILAIKASLGNVTQARIGHILGISREHVNIRLRGLARKLSECDDIALAGDLLRSAVPLAAAVVVGNIADGEYGAAKDILQHFGVMVPKSESTNRNMPAGRAEIIEAAQNLPANEYEELRRELCTDAEPAQPS